MEIKLPQHTSHILIITPDVNKDGGVKHYSIDLDKLTSEEINNGTKDYKLVRTLFNYSDRGEKNVFYTLYTYNSYIVLSYCSKERFLSRYNINNYDRSNIDEYFDQNKLFVYSMNNKNKVDILTINKYDTLYKNGTLFEDNEDVNDTECIQSWLLKHNDKSVLFNQKRKQYQKSYEKVIQIVMEDYQWGEDLNIEIPYNDENLVDCIYSFVYKNMDPEDYDKFYSKEVSEEELREQYNK